jgi:ABC exporter DevB family membrane fusion protein
MNILRTSVIFLIGLALGIGAMLAFRTDSRRDSHGSRDGERASSVNDSSQPNLGLPSRQSIAALGTIEPRDGILQISSALVGYRIERVYVQDGQLVKADQLLIDLDAAPAKAEHDLALSRQAEAIERQQSEIDLAKRRVAAAELSVRQAAEGRVFEIEAQQSKVSVAAARKKQADRDLERLKDLHDLAEPLASEQQVEQQRLLSDTAVAEQDASQAALKRLEQSLAFQEQTAAAELRAARQSLALAEKGTGLESLALQVEIAALKLQQTKIMAPSGGVVLSVRAHPGEVISQQPLLQLADLDHLVCVAEVEPADVPYLQSTQRATVKCRAFQGSVVEGTIDRIGNQITQASLRPLDPRQPVDRNVTRVVVLIDSRSAARLINQSGKDRRAALVGLQVEVTFPLTRQGQSK